MHKRLTENWYGRFERGIYRTVVKNQGFSNYNQFSFEPTCFHPECGSSFLVFDTWFVTNTLKSFGCVFSQLNTNVESKIGDTCQTVLSSDSKNNI